MSNPRSEAKRSVFVSNGWRQNWSTLAGWRAASWNQSLCGGEAGIRRLNLTLDVQILSPQRWPDSHLSFMLSPLRNQCLPLECVFHPKFWPLRERTFIRFSPQNALILLLKNYHGHSQAEYISSESSCLLVKGGKDAFFYLILLWKFFCIQCIHSDNTSQPSHFSLLIFYLSFLRFITYICICLFL